MKTILLKINKISPKKKEINIASKIIKNNGIVIFPTETVYGIGANAFNDKAVMNIFKAKNRPADNPLIVHVSSLKELNIVGVINKNAKKLIEKFWPGPLTIILEKKDCIPFSVTAGMNSVAVRMPKNKIALKLIKKSGVPIAAPSANISGKPSGTRIKDIMDDFCQKVNCIIDGGDCEIGIESTIIDLTSDKAILLRPGKITAEEIENEIGKIEIPEYVRKKINVKKPKSPGLKYTHYSPKARVILVESKNTYNRNEKIKILEKKYLKDEKKIMIIRSKNKQKMASELFAKFRDADRNGIDIIIVEGTSEEGIGLALMNRLRKAASEIIET
jgi:L-threonylcarbamoyladenylate synthase